MICLCAPFGTTKSPNGILVFLIIAVIRNEADYDKNRNYWKYLKSKLKRENGQLGSTLPKRGEYSEN